MDLVQGLYTSSRSCEHHMTSWFVTIVPPFFQAFYSSFEKIDLCSLVLDFWLKASNLQKTNICKRDHKVHQTFGQSDKRSFLTSTCKLPQAYPLYWTPISTVLLMWLRTQLCAHKPEYRYPFRGPELLVAMLASQVLKKRIFIISPPGLTELTLTALKIQIQIIHTIYIANHFSTIIVMYITLITNTVNAHPINNLVNNQDTL